MRLPGTRRANAANEHPAFSSDSGWADVWDAKNQTMMPDRVERYRTWSIDLGGVLVEVRTADRDWPPGEDIGRRIAFDREIERALRRLVGPMNTAVQGSMFEEAADD